MTQYIFSKLILNIFLFFCLPLFLKILFFILSSICLFYSGNCKRIQQVVFMPIFHHTRLVYILTRILFSALFIVTVKGVICPIFSRKLLMTTRTPYGTRRKTNFSRIFHGQLNCRNTERVKFAHFELPSDYFLLNMNH